MSQYKVLYCDRRGLAAEGEGHDTVGCIVTVMQVWLGENCVTIQLTVL